MTRQNAHRDDERTAVSLTHAHTGAREATLTPNGEGGSYILHIAAPSACYGSMKRGSV